ncbi:uncharacterized protein [Onthophagus taurus]|uniref:uncharacterized protein n=1 Tax=Onthophagus taurus TaxID=166361 RepID=UPI0039BE2138
MDVDTDLLITLIEARPVLWDKSEENYKNKNGTANAWEEVFNALNADYQKMQEKEKKYSQEKSRNDGQTYGIHLQRVVKKKKQKRKVVQGYQQASNICIYSKQLEFLKKLYVSREVDDNFEPTRDDSLQDDAIMHFDVETSIEPSPSTSSTATTSTRHSKRRGRKMDEFDERILKVIEAESPNHHISFFNGIVPALEEFNEGEILQFQMGVLQLIANINQQ